MPVDRPAPLHHGMADIEPGLRLHYVLAGEGARTIVLLHGFPQTWWQWHHVMRPLVGAGFRVIAPDYRGAGDSWRPTSGYDKRTMARDIHRLLHDHLRVREPAIIAGDVAELLVAGRERQYIQYFSNARIFDPGAISAADLDVYVTAYSAPGAMRAAFEVYRAFGQDADDNRRLLREKGRLNIPVLALGGTISTTGAVIEEMTKEVAEDVTAARIAGAGHWIAEENPQAVVAEVLGFVAG